MGTKLPIDTITENSNNSVYPLFSERIKNMEENNVATDPNIQPKKFI